MDKKTYINLRKNSSVDGNSWTLVHEFAKETVHKNGIKNPLTVLIVNKQFFMQLTGDFIKWIIAAELQRFPMANAQSIADAIFANMLHAATEYFDKKFGVTLLTKVEKVPGGEDVVTILDIY